MKLHIYAANLHGGGAVVGAASLIDTLVQQRLDDELSDISEMTFEVSSRVKRELLSPRVDQELRGVRWIVTDDRASSALHRRSDASDVRLVVRGPDYRRRSAAIEVLGFADGNTVRHHAAPDRPSRRFSWREAKRTYKRRRLAMYDAFVVQTPSMSEALSSLVAPRPVALIPNAVSRIFYDPSRWAELQLPPRVPGEIRLFYPARGYAHKNHRFIPAVADQVAQQSGRVLRVVTTLRDDELHALFPAIPSSIINVGELMAAQCPTAYRATDGLFFPSCSETFSISPLEAVVMKRPVVAARFDFSTTMLGERATYYSPDSPREAARAVLRIVESGKGRSGSGDGGCFEDPLLLTPHEQAQAYVKVLRSLVP